MIIDIKFYFSKIIKLVHNAFYYLLKLDTPAAFNQTKNKLQCKEIFSLLINYNNNIIIMHLFATHNKIYLQPTFSMKLSIKYILIFYFYA